MSPKHLVGVRFSHPLPYSLAYARLFFIDATSLMVYNGVNKCGWYGNTRNGVESGVDT